MRTIDPVLTPELRKHVGDSDVAKSPPFKILDYRELVKHVARLAYLNKDHLLFFRGQDQDYQTRAGASTFYPSIYRGDQLPRREATKRFEVLEKAARRLREVLASAKVDGYLDVARKKFIQWSILQHYEVCATPLLDFTQSLRVACSFAQAKKSDGQAFVYVFGLPYLTNRISINSEHDIVNIRLLSICPPDALRPYFQEGYLAGTADITDDYDSKTELDFRNRLIAKFSIPTISKFWGKGLSGVPRLELYPTEDRIRDLCASIEPVVLQEFQPGTLGEFMAEWAVIENILVARAQRRRERLLSAGKALQVLAEDNLIDTETARALDEIRKLRNKAVHEPSTVSSDVLRDAIDSLSHLRKILIDSKLDLSSLDWQRESIYSESPNTKTSDVVGTRRRRK